MDKIKKTLSLGFVGGSLNSAIGYAHFVSCRMDGYWSVDAGCFSRDTSINEKTGRFYGVELHRLYPTWQAMLQNEKNLLDAILVLTPTPSHYEIVIACLNEGIPVICEKALALNTTQAKRILELQKTNHGFLAITYNYSGYPIVRLLREKIRKGQLGKIQHFQAEMPQDGFIKTDETGQKLVPQAWRLADNVEIPIIYLDLVVHLHQLIHYLIAEKPIAVIAQQASYGWFDVIDNVTCLVHYTNNIQGQFWFSKSTLGYRNGLKLRIFGSKASAEWSQINPEELFLYYPDGRREILDCACSTTDFAHIFRYNRFKPGHPVGFLEAFANLYVDIATCLWQYKETGYWISEEVYSVEFALNELYFLEAIVRSVKQHAWQDIVNLNKL